MPTAKAPPPRRPLPERRLLALAAAMALALPAATAQTPGQPPGQWSTVTTAPAAPSQAAAAQTAQPTPAKVLFGAVKTPTRSAPQAIGGYADGCLAGARALPIDGTGWQVMRLSRNRNWGHPALVAWLERYARETQAQDGWPGLLVGDMSQPRGGPMITGHASHQIGLDTDIWFTPSPGRVLSGEEREQMSAVSMLGPDKLSVDPARWSETHERILERAASSPEVERVFVNPAIKRKLCADAATLGPDRSWLAKIRPWWDHHDHFHVRLACPRDSPGCRPQKPPAADDGCGKELDDWFKMVTAPPPPKPEKPQPPPPPMTLDRLPAECRVVLAGGTPKVAAPASATAKAAPSAPDKPKLSDVFQH